MDTPYVITAECVTCGVEWVVRSGSDAREISIHLHDTGHGGVKVSHRGHNPKPPRLPR